MNTPGRLRYIGHGLSSDAVYANVPASRAFSEQRGVCAIIEIDRRHSTGWVKPSGTSMVLVPGHDAVAEVAARLAADHATSTRRGEERNRSTRVWVKTGSPAPTYRAWSRPDTHPDEDYTATGQDPGGSVATA